MEGGLGSSLVDGIWEQGDSDEAIARVIREGLPDLGMEAYGDILTEEQIRSLVILIRERNVHARQAELDERTRARDGVFTSDHHDFRLEVLGERRGILWSLDFLPDGRKIVTQKSGELWILDAGEWHGPIQGTPDVWDHGQGGLMEVALHPDYAGNGWIYLAFSERTPRRFGRGDTGYTALVRGRLDGLRWTDEQEIFRAPADFHSRSGVHFGSRIVFQDGFLFFTIGDRGQQNLAQQLENPSGKVHRIHDDGRVPADNPFAGERNAFPTIWTYGNRNAQGLAIHPQTGEIWESEHGPRGGDEINLIERGLNYGWPVITHGMNYNGTPITGKTAKDGMEQPALHWTPSIAVCGIDFYSGDRFPAWKHNLFVGGLASEQLHRLVIEDGQVVEDEIILRNQGRIRHVINGPDGYLYLLLETRRHTGPGLVARLVPAP